jgi:hypothetical protein
LPSFSDRISPSHAIHPTHVYEVRPCKDHRGVDLISDALPFGRLWYGEVANAISYAKIRSRSHQAVIRVYDDRAVEKAVGKRYPRQCQMNLRHLKSMFLMRLI